MMNTLCALVILVVTLADNALAFSSGAPSRSSACKDLIQMHYQVTPEECKSPCPFSVMLSAIDDVPPSSSKFYRCGSRHTVTILSNGPTFRGFAIQAREFTEEFIKDAKFVGAFVNPPPKGDWRIWNCAAPCATHSQANKKTSIDLTWWAPSNEFPLNMTLWLAITREFKTVHTHIRGLDLLPDPVFCNL